MRLLHLKWQSRLSFFQKRSSKGMYPKKGFGDKNMSIGGSESGRNVTERARVPILRQGEEPSREGKYGEHLSVKQKRLASQSDRAANISGRDDDTERPRKRLQR